MKNGRNNIRSLPHATGAEHAGRGAANERGAAQAWIVGGVLLATLGFGLTGCGSHERGAASTEDVASGAIVVPASQGSATATAASAGFEAGTSSAVEPVETEASESTGLPPDIIVTASDTLVHPGQAVDFVVQATPDVTEMSLYDGMGDRQALVYDSDAKAWRVTYRVPLRFPWDRAGLSITAKNESQRWCRSWIFLKMAQDSQAVEGAVGTSGGESAESPETPE